MLSERELERLGKRIVEAMLIARKRNVRGVARAKKFFPRINALLERFDGKVVSAKGLAAVGVQGRVLERLCNPDLGPILAQRGKGFAVRSSIGECVRIAYHPDNWPLARQVVLATCRKGCHAAWTPRSSELGREAVRASPLAQLEDFPAMVPASLRSVDATIYIECEDDPAWKNGLSALKLAAGRECDQKAHEIIDSRRVRWLVVGWPFASTARKLGVSPRWFRKMLFGALEESFSARTRRLVQAYSLALRGGSRVRLSHRDGTDLRFNITGRPILADSGFLTATEVARGDVGLNLPAGEVFCAPIEGSAEGTVVFPKVFIEGHGFAECLKLEFKRGRVARFSAVKGAEHFRKYLAENTPSTRVLAELGIGCNSRARFSGYVLTDEKVAGTIHLAIGNNTGGYHGRNKASGHLDMVKPMRGGVLEADGRVVMRGGRLVAANKRG